MSPRRGLVILLEAAAAAVAAVRHGSGAARERRVLGGILIGDAVVYDMQSRFLLGPFVGRVAADVTALAPNEARLPEVGCLPGHLSIRLARQQGLEVTGLDLTTAMIERAPPQRRASRGTRQARHPSFLVGDVASLHTQPPIRSNTCVVLHPSGGQPDAMALALAVQTHPQRIERWACTLSWRI
jgi:Methyltransferase domain